MSIYAKRLVFVLFLVWLAGDQIAAATKNQIPMVESDQIIVQPREPTHRVGFFRKEQCKADGALIVSFRDGVAIVNHLEPNHAGGMISGDLMTFHLGGPSCQITIQIRRRDDIK
jgi:hypothetical protein